MPDKGIVTTEQIVEEEKDFDEVFNDIVDKSDEDLQAEADKAKETDEDSGESKKDQSADAVGGKPVEDPIKPASSDPNPESDTEAGLTQDDWKVKAEKFEADLQKERQRTSSWDGRIKAANKKAKELEAEVKMLRAKLDEKDSGPSEEEQSDQEVMDKFKETFPELVEVIDIMQRKIDAKASPAKDPGQSDTTDDDLDPESANSDDNVDDTNVAVCDMNEVRKIHRDVDEAVSSGKIVTWINSQPDYIRPSLENVYYGANGYGSTQQVIDLVNNFKTQTGWTSDLLKTEDTKADKLNSMMESEGGSGGPVDKTGPDKSDYDAAAKDAGF